MSERKARHPDQHSSRRSFAAHVACCVVRPAGAPDARWINPVSLCSEFIPQLLTTSRRSYVCLSKRTPRGRDLSASLCSDCISDGRGAQKARRPSRAHRHVKGYGSDGDLGAGREIDRPASHTRARRRPLRSIVRTPACLGGHNMETRLIIG